MGATQQILGYCVISVKIMCDEVFFLCCHIYPSFSRKRIVSLYFGRNVRTRLGAAICDMSGPPVFHTNTEESRLVACPRTQQANFPACSSQPPLNADRQAGKLCIPFFKGFWYDSTRGLNSKSTDCEADALTTTLLCRWPSFLCQRFGS